MQGRGASGPDPRPSPAGGGDLPAPYEGPWLPLQRDLLALLASLRLKLQELWRRNREGDLSVPGFWPDALTSWFWPLLLVLAVALVALLPPQAQRLLRSSVAPPLDVSVPAALTPALAGSAGLVPDGSSAAPTRPPEPPPPAPPLELQLDPLLALLAGQDPQQLIHAARPNPAAARLELELDERFRTLPDAEQQRWAAEWLQRSEQLGYEQLGLVDSQGLLLGRRAQVGSGMILFASPASP